MLVMAEEDRPLARRGWPQGLAVVESNDLAAVTRWVGGWNHLGDATITPVLADEEAGAVAQQDDLRQA